MIKTIYTLAIDYPEAITKLTFPLMEQYAHKIGAYFHVIDKRKFPEWPLVYEKLQIHEYGVHNDWNLFFDADALIHPALFDVTEELSKDTVLFCERDLVGNRFRSDKYFRRDPRRIGATNWFTVASDWCLDLWEPLQNMAPEIAYGRIVPQPVETAIGITPEHLIDDYVLSRNIARYGLRVTWFADVLRKLRFEGQNYFWHSHMIPTENKADVLRDVLEGWKIKI